MSTLYALPRIVNIRGGDCKEGAFDTKYYTQTNGAAKRPARRLEVPQQPRRRAMGERDMIRTMTILMSQREQGRTLIIFPPGSTCDFADTIGRRDKFKTAFPGGEEWNADL